jgi:predicted kinase
MVRALVAGIREHQPGNAAAQGRAHREFATYVALARSLSAPGRPALMLMHGLSGSGKTTVSQGLLQKLGAVRVRSDVERKRLHGLPAGARTHTELSGGIYAPEITRLTYDRLKNAARGVVESGYRAIVDAAFLRRAERDAFRDLARDAGAASLIVSCEAPEDALRERIAGRERAASDASEAGVAVLEVQLATSEPLGEDELARAVRIETEGGDAATRAAIAEIAERLAG